MLVWGKKTRIKDLGLISGITPCPSCKKNDTLRLMLNYTCSHIWYLFSWVSKKQYFNQCTACNFTEVVDSKKTESQLKQSPIPWIQAKGWTLLAGFVFITLVLNYIHTNIKDKLEREYIESPQVGDQYIVDFSNFEKLKGQTQYGILRIIEVNIPETSIVFEPSNLVYNRSSGPANDVRLGKTKEDDYFSKEKIKFKIDELKVLKNSHKITEIYRSLEK